MPVGLSLSGCGFARQQRSESHQARRFSPVSGVVRPDSRRGCRTRQKRTLAKGGAPRHPEQAMFRSPFVAGQRANWEILDESSRERPCPIRSPPDRSGHASRGRSENRVSSQLTTEAARWAFSRLATAETLQLEPAPRIRSRPSAPTESREPTEHCSEPPACSHRHRRTSLRLLVRRSSMTRRAEPPCREGGTLERDSAPPHCW